MMLVALRRLRFAALPAVFVLAVALVARADDKAPETSPAADESWQVVEMAGSRVGYSHVTTTRRTGDDGKEIIVCDSMTHMQLKRFNQSLKVTERLHTEETTDGQLLGFRYRMDNPPISSMETVGTIRGDQLTLETHANGATETSESDWDPTVKSPAWQDRELEEHPLKQGEKRSFPVYLPPLNQVLTMTLTESGPAKTKLLDGTEIDATRIVISHSSFLLPSIDAFMDKEGHIVKTETKLLSVLTFTVDRETALKEIDDQPADLAIETLVKVEPITKAHDRQRIVYRVTLPDGKAAEAFPNGPTQQVTKVSETEADIAVTARPAAPSGDAGPPEEKYLKPTRFLDCENSFVREHAEKAAAKGGASGDAARAMEKYVHDTMRDRNFATGLATASEVAEKLEGDCTEHAVLLAAMLRARKIPSRVAVGLVYSEQHQAFAGHMWTEAYLDGVWTPLDATLGKGGIGPAHIKVADSALDEDAPTPIAAFLPMLHLLGQMKLAVVSVE
jgi:hypothetical protein